MKKVAAHFNKNIPTRYANYDAYMKKLMDSFNPVAASNVMCKFTISVGCVPLFYYYFSWFAPSSNL